MPSVNEASSVSRLLEQAPLGVVVGHRKCTAVSVSGFLCSADAAQQLAPSRVQVVVVIACEAIEDVEPRLGTFCFGNGDCPVQLHNR